MLRSRVTHVGVARSMTRPSLQGQAQRLYTANNSSSATKAKSTAKFALAAGVIGTQIYWWMSPTPDRDNEVPRLEGTPTDELVFDKGPSKEEVSRILNEHAYSYTVKNVGNVDRYDGAQLASSDPCEDRFLHGQFPAPWGGRRPWMAWGIFDGQLSWETADLLEKQLLPIVRQNLRKVEWEAKKEKKGLAVHVALIEAFRSFDASLMQAIKGVCESKEPLQDKLKKVIPAYTGSCALLSLYDPLTHLLHVSHTGTSRAVFAEQQQAGNWTSMDLSADHNVLNPKEIERITESHPGEEDVIKDHTLMGLITTRAFGLAQWKLPAAVRDDLEEKLLAPIYSPGRDGKKPPCIIAVPDSISVEIKSNIPSFMIMASPGLWQFLTSQQAVDLVVKWMESQEDKQESTPEPMYEPFHFDQFVKGEVSWPYTEERLTVQDDNAAVHLVRNALGGNHHELVAGRLGHMAPVNQFIREDITVQVVFFNKDKQEPDDSVSKELMRHLWSILCSG
ncbi:putative pyruvate dehydrogenase [Rostrohypoxylon terebratum]|nr:putative pyruvate dehydrogenase [Rostrohypoxylon terebratum]